MFQSTQETVRPPAPDYGLPIPQPAKGIITMRRIGNAQLARQIGLSPQRTSRILNGYDNASERFMDACSQTLDMPIDELLRPEGRNGV